MRCTISSFFRFVHRTFHAIRMNIDAFDETIPFVSNDAARALLDRATSDHVDSDSDRIISNLGWSANARFFRILNLFFSEINIKAIYQTRIDFDRLENISVLDHFLLSPSLLPNVVSRVGKLLLSVWSFVIDWAVCLERVRNLDKATNEPCFCVQDESSSSLALVHASYDSRLVSYNFTRTKAFSLILW